MICEKRIFGRLSVLGSLMFMAAIFISSCGVSPESDTAELDENTVAESVDAGEGTVNSAGESGEPETTQSSKQSGEVDTGTERSESESGEPETTQDLTQSEEVTDVAQSASGEPTLGLFCGPWLIIVDSSEADGWTYSAEDVSLGTDEGDIFLTNGTYNDSSRIIEYQWVNDLGEELVIYTVAQDSDSGNTVLRVEETFQGDQSVVLEENCDPIE